MYSDSYLNVFFRVKNHTYYKYELCGQVKALMAEVKLQKIAKVKLILNTRCTQGDSIWV